MNDFEEYWNKYGELHASFCNGDIKLFASEIWKSAKGYQPEQEEKQKIKVKVNEPCPATFQSVEDVRGFIDQEEKSCETCDNAYAEKPNKRCSICINENNRGNLYSQWQPKEEEKPAPAEWEPEACILNTDAQLSPDHTVNKINHNTDGIQLALDEVKKLKDEIVSSHNQLYNRIQGGERELEDRIKQLEDKE